MLAVVWRMRARAPAGRGNGHVNRSHLDINVAVFGVHLVCLVVYSSIRKYPYVVSYLVIWLFGHSVIRLFGCLVVWLFGYLVIWLFGHLVI